MATCPLCLNKKNLTKVKGPDSRGYRLCNKCMLIFVETGYLPSVHEEKKRYLTHNNGIQYPGYVKFLNQAVEPALILLKKEMESLDYGCGPTPTLGLLLKKEGYKCDDYDPLFFPELPAKLYDFIFATECFEHFFFPDKEIGKIYEILKPGGYLFIMTETWNSLEAFSTWHYARDFTHVSFFHYQTFGFIAEKYGFKVNESGNQRLMILQKKQQ